jgi:hypothetical protein
MLKGFALVEHVYAGTGFHAAGVFDIADGLGGKVEHFRLRLRGRERPVGDLRKKLHDTGEDPAKCLHADLASEAFSCSLFPPFRFRVWVGCAALPIPRHNAAFTGRLVGAVEPLGVQHATATATELATHCAPQVRHRSSSLGSVSCHHRRRGGSAGLSAV